MISTAPYRSSLLSWNGLLCVLLLSLLSPWMTCGMSISSSSRSNTPESKSSTSTENEVVSMMSSSQRRREYLQHVVVGLSVIGGGLLFAEPAWAARARGAFELDSEYYLRDLLGGNKKEGNILPSKPPPMPPPRQLQGTLLPLLLDNEYTESCVPVQALIRQVITVNKQSSSTTTAVAQSIAQSAMDYRTKSARSFSNRAQWDQEDVSDQYYFDLSSYALWKTAADYLPNYTQRDVFVRNVGRILYQKMLAPPKTTTTTQSTTTASTSKGSLVASETEVFAILNAFKECNFIKGYKVGNDDTTALQSPGMGGKQKQPQQQQQQQQQEQTPVFDQLDDEAIQNGASVDCLVSVYEPATLGASLQITGEQSRFAPDYVGATLAAMWESQFGIRSSWEIFFVDPEYRPNPKDYYPNEKLLQFTLTLQQ